LAASDAAIHTAAGAREHDLRVVLIHLNAENIGVVEHSGMDGGPGDPAVQSLPGEMGSAGIQRIPILGIEGQRHDRTEVAIIIGRNFAPVFAAVFAQVHAIAGPGG
jgi:hypothetical protein